MPRHRSMIILLASVALTSGAAHAAGAIYKWVDQNGITQYTQTPPPKNAKSSQTVRVSTHIPADVREGHARGMVDAETLQAYTSPTPGAGGTPVPEKPPTNTSTNPEPAAPTQGTPLYSPAIPFVSGVPRSDANAN